MAKMDYLTSDAGDHKSTEARPGMAYFAGTGPFGARCESCKSFSPPIRGRGARCLLFMKMMGGLGRTIRHTYAACKYYERSTEFEKPPEKPARRRRRRQSAPRRSFQDE